MADRVLVCHEDGSHRHCTVVDSLEVIRNPSLRNTRSRLHFYTEAVREKDCKQLLAEQSLPVFRESDTAPHNRLRYQLDVDPECIRGCGRVFVEETIAERFEHFTPLFAESPRPYAQRCKIPGHQVARLGKNGLEAPRNFQRPPQLASREDVIAMANRTPDTAFMVNTGHPDAVYSTAAPPRKHH